MGRVSSKRFRAAERGPVLALALLILLASPGLAFGQDLLLPEWKYEPAPDTSQWKKGTGKAAEVGWSILNDTVSDSWSIAKSPLHWRLKEWFAVGAIAGVTTGLIYGVDQKVREGALNNPGFHDFGENIRWIATGPGLAALTGGFALTGFLLDRPKELETARLLVEASASGFVFTALGKYTLGRSRPRYNQGPFEFNPFGGDASMPSGETTSAFIMAGVITSQYPHWAVQLGAYSLATAVGAGRIALDAHWTSDVFISAALGIAVSKAVVYFHRKRVEERKRKGAKGGSTAERRHFFQVSPRGFRWTVVY